ncbi:hypothetical protein Bbelb_051540 [Branchiostoma belcheri]|nr:hypothetical protein Bbelb_051540 [Branchiostoma belcheri]
MHNTLPSVEIQRERLLLKTYKTCLRTPMENPGPGKVDQKSVDILQNFHPAMLWDYRPVEVLGDGNCLYRALSQAMYGTQHHHLIRLLTALEIAEFPTHYNIEHPNHVDHIKDSRLVLAKYNDLLLEAATSGSYSCMQHIFAASSAVGLCFESYCPPMVPSERVVGRGIRTSKGVAFTVMWTSTRLPESTRDFSPNHFVPLKEILSAVKRAYVSTDASATEPDYVSTDASVTEPDYVSTDASVTEPDYVSTDASVKEPDYVSTDASVTEPDYVSTDASVTEPDYVSTDASLFCHRHIRKNCEDHLQKKIGMADSMKRPLISALFGTNGVTAAKTKVVFEERLRQATQLANEANCGTYIKEQVIPLAIPLTIEDQPFLLADSAVSTWCLQAKLSSKREREMETELDSNWGRKDRENDDIGVLPDKLQSPVSCGQYMAQVGRYKVMLMDLASMVKPEAWLPDQDSLFAEDETIKDAGTEKDEQNVQIQTELMWVKTADIGMIFVMDVDIANEIVHKGNEGGGGTGTPVSNNTQTRNMSPMANMVAPSWKRLCRHPDVGHVAARFKCCPDRPYTILVVHVHGLAPEKLSRRNPHYLAKKNGMEHNNIHFSLPSTVADRLFSFRAAAYAIGRHETSKET